MKKYAIYQSEVGLYKIGYESNKVFLIQKVERIEENLKYSKFSDDVFFQLEQYFKGIRKEFDFEIKLEGTSFQVKVWNELLKIPYATTITYKQLAKNIGNIKACRAVGNANNKNKIAIVIPCHRVVGSNGKLIGYAGGIDLKQHLIQLEKKNSGNN